MMIDILKCHQPNKDGIVKMMYRADFCGLQRLSKEAHEFYGEIGLDEIKPGDAMGFGTDNLLELDFSGQLDDNGRPIVAMDYKVMPKPKYWGEY